MWTSSVVSKTAKERLWRVLETEPSLARKKWPHASVLGKTPLASRFQLQLAGSLSRPPGPLCTRRNEWRFDPTAYLQSSPWRTTYKVPDQFLLFLHLQRYTSLSPLFFTHLSSLLCQSCSYTCAPSFGSVGCRILWTRGLLLNPKVCVLNSKVCV